MVSNADPSCSQSVCSLSFTLSTSSVLHRRNCILADEMGLGKTIQSITFLYEIYMKGIEGPFLVIAPLSTIPNWEREFRTWTELNAVVYHGSQASRKTIQAYEMYYRDAQVNRKRKGCWSVLKWGDISCWWIMFTVPIIRLTLQITKPVKTVIWVYFLYLKTS